ncbi:aromatase/cyclase [Natronosporangium hydrolyticum]|uniref:Aromatase/cyclase n=1 Tax=Natronosporangium hydrolyticum TaxID=2811111 RepID=A0A895YKV2_9ACTN|nr:aromatase/cyclase [Natronosporangium hydrolyticum]QSB15923.1 aromatase/cyclase [Natronosporangium hydrolyticum]
MSTSPHREVEHEIVIAAPASKVYRLIAEVENWPQLFPPTIFVDHIERSDRSERIRIWALANGQAKTWTSRRELDPTSLRITFRQEVSAHPVAAMGGAWYFEALTPDETRVRLLHDYRAVNDEPTDLAWIDEAVDRNSQAELVALKSIAETAEETAELTFAFTDTVQVDGSVKDVFDFINQAERWTERLPHVAAVTLAEEQPGVQTLEMTTRAKNGSTHLTKSYRVTFPHQRIAYKQVTLPALLAVHTGIWTFTENGSGVAASSQHTVVLNPTNIAHVLGPDADVAQARSYVRNALSSNSLATLEHARTYAEQHR